MSTPQTPNYRINTTAAQRIDIRAGHAGVIEAAAAQWRKSKDAKVQEVVTKVDTLVGPVTDLNKSADNILAALALAAKGDASALSIALHANEDSVVVDPQAASEIFASLAAVNSQLLELTDHTPAFHG